MAFLFCFFSFKYFICIFTLTLCSEPTRSYGVDLFRAFKSLGFQDTEGHGGWGGQLLLLPLVKTDRYLLTYTWEGIHNLTTSLKYMHKDTAARWMVQVCENVAMWEFPKAMKYAGCNSRADSLDLTTYVQRKGLLLARQHTCPVNTASILPHLFLPTHPSLQHLRSKNSYLNGLTLHCVASDYWSHSQ